MLENDTVKLLREADAGVKMGIAIIDEVIDCAKEEDLKTILTDSKERHESLRPVIASQLKEVGEEGKEPPLFAKGMSWMKTNLKLTVDPTDETVADLITDGCDMGIKSLSRYLNQYKNATAQAKDAVRDLIAEEESLERALRSFL